VIQLVLEALGVLNANRTRTALTMLGLVIGVMAVIAIQVAGAGLEGAIEGTLGSINDRSFTLIPNTRQGDFSRAQIKYEDVQRAKRDVPNILEGVPFGANARYVRAGHHGARLQIGAESDARFNTTPLRYGRAFDAADIAGAAHVCLLSDNAYTRLFPDGGDPTGTSLRLGERRYVIAGVLQKPNGVEINIGRRDIEVPYTTFARDFAHGAILFGARFIVDHTDEASQILIAGRPDLPPDLVKSVMADLVKMKVYGVNGGIDRDVIDYNVKLSVDLKMLASPVKYEEVADRSLVDEILKEIGTR